MYLKAFSGILKSKKVPEIFWYLLWFVNNKDYAQSICSTLKCIPHSLFAEFPNCILRWNPLILDSFCNDIFPCSSTVYLRTEPVFYTVLQHFWYYMWEENSAALRCFFRIFPGSYLLNFVTFFVHRHC